MASGVQGRMDLSVPGCGLVAAADAGEADLGGLRVRGEMYRML